MYLLTAKPRASTTDAQRTQATLAAGPGGLFAPALLVHGGSPLAKRGQCQLGGAIRVACARERPTLENFSVHETWLFRDGTEGLPSESLQTCDFSGEVAACKLATRKLACHDLNASMELKRLCVVVPK